LALQHIQADIDWASFRATRKDVEHIFALFLEHETPLTNQQIVLAVVRERLAAQEDALRKQLRKSTIYQPQQGYQVGQEILFPAFDFATGIVLSMREGNNPEYGEFSVLEVEFGAGKNKTRREMAANLKTQHKLALAESTDLLKSIDRPTAETILETHSEQIIEEMEAAMVNERDAVFISGKWFLKSLLAPADIGVLHLAEAVLDMVDGGPQTTEHIAEEISFAPTLAPALRAFSLEAALAQDPRFDNVGPTGQTLWFLHSAVPDEVLEMPPRLEHRTEAYNPADLRAELRDLESELNDELSPFEPAEPAHKEAVLNLIYPHRRVGTLPLNRNLISMFPTSEESPYVRVVMIDGQTKEEFAAWVVYGSKYVAGFSEFYRRHRLPIGAYVSVKQTAEPNKFLIDFKAHRPRSEYIRLAVPNGARLTFDNFKRSIGADYDELLILGAEDIEGVDQVWSQTLRNRRPLADILADLMPELGKLNPQNVVHAKTLYSAVNVVRRTPPGPIFAVLATRPQFEHVDGPYWRLATGKSSN
jgi:hypothetical protein